MKLVPVEPTEEMISNAWREAVGKCDHETIKRIYAAMLTAAPKAPDGWVPVSERMPLTPSDGCEYSDIEVSAFDGERVFTAHYAIGSLPQLWGDWVNTNANITHWQHLPVAPKVKP